MNLKAIISVAMVSVGSVAAPLLVVAPPNGHIKLSWPYDTNLLSTNLFFNVYETTNVQLPLSQWNALTNVVGTNTFVFLDVQPGVHGFVLTASNLWGETSVASPIGTTPPVATPINNAVKIEKAP